MFLKLLKCKSLMSNKLYIHSYMLNVRDLQIHNMETYLINYICV